MVGLVEQRWCGAWRRSSRGWGRSGRRTGSRAVRRNNPALREPVRNVPAAAPRCRGSRRLEGRYPEACPTARFPREGTRLPPGVRSARHSPASAARPVTPPARTGAASGRVGVRAPRGSATGPCSAAPLPPSGGRSPPPPPAGDRRTGTATRLPRTSSAAASPSPASAAEGAPPPAPPRTLPRRGRHTRWKARAQAAPPANAMPRSVRRRHETASGARPATSAGCCTPRSRC